MATDLIAIGIIRRAVGLSGLCGVETLGDTFAKLKPPCSVRVGLSESSSHDREIEFIERRSQGYACRFRGSEDRDAAEELRGQVIYLDQASLPALEPGRYYHFELKGMVVASDDGTLLGRVIDVHNFPSADTIEVGRDKGEPFMVPIMNEAIISIDKETRRITVNGSYIEELLQ